MTAEFRAVPADVNNWGDLESLFEGRGGPHYCWCMAWRTKPPEVRQARGSARQEILKRIFKERVDQGVPVGMIGYCGGAPAGWVSVAPRESYRPLNGLHDPNRSDGSVWSIACFYIQRKLRGAGLCRWLAAAAVEYARSMGADMVEAFPADDDSPSYGFMGRTGMFRDLGFKPAGRAGARRTVMRLKFENSG